MPVWGLFFSFFWWRSRNLDSNNHSIELSMHKRHVYWCSSPEVFRCSCVQDITMWGVWIWWSRSRILIQPRAYAEWKVLPKKKGRPASFSALNIICLDCRCFFYAFYSYRKSIAVVCKFGGSVKRLPIMGFSCKFLSDKSCSIFFLVSSFSLQCWGRDLFFIFPFIVTRTSISS